MESLLRRIDLEIAAIGGKRSRSRARVIEVFFQTRTHVTVEELSHAVRKRNRSVGYATVYRTMKLLAKLGYANELDFGDGLKRYESNLESHHDHLVCQECGLVFEFQEPRIESLQEQVAQQHGFQSTMHRLDIYGFCRQCARSKKKET